MATVGSLIDRPASAVRGSDYAQLSKRVRDAGLLGRRSGYYAFKIIVTVLAFAGAWVAFVMIGPTWWQLGIAAMLAVLYTQVAFIGHDAATSRSSGPGARTTCSA